jgi:peptide/nickel transport system permease protein
MLADGRTYFSTSWWLALFPGLCILFNVLGINLLGDGLRDLLDPRLKAIVIGHRVAHLAWHNG